MKRTYYVKSLLRSPVRTLITLLLAAAAVFLFLYNLAEYDSTRRQYLEASGRYQGVLTVAEQEVPELVDARYSFFLLTDETNPGRTFDRFSYEEYHHQSLQPETVDYLSNLPYIDRVDARYMSSGVSASYGRMDNDMNCYPYANRCIVVATLNNIERLDFGRVATSPMSKQNDDKARSLQLSNIEFLAGDENWLADTDRVLLRVLSDEAKDKYAFFADSSGNHSRFTTCFFDLGIFGDTVDGLVKGNRYVFVLRYEPYHAGGGEFLVGDDSRVDWWPYITDVTNEPEGWLDTEEFAPLRELIRVTNDDLHTFDMVYTDDMASLRRAANGRLRCTEGRFLTPADAEQPVCVVSTAFLEQNGLQVGDSVTLSLGDYLCEQYAPLGAVASTRGRYAKSFTPQTFTIVGSWLDLNEGEHVNRDYYWCYSDNAIFVPTSFLPATADTDKHSFKPGEMSFVISNAENIVPFMEEVLPELEAKGWQADFQDGGWPAIAEQLLQAQSLALSKLLIFSAAALFAILLAVWLFISRKKREYGILRALGMESGSASSALFVPLAILGAVASLLGGILAAIISRRDMLSAQETTAIPVSAPSVLLFLLGAGVFYLLLLAFGGTGVALLRRKSILRLIQGGANQEKQRKARRVSSSKRARASSRSEKSKNWSLRYLRHFFSRRLGRSLLSLLLAALLCFAFGQLTALRQIYTQLYQDVRVEAMFYGGLPYSTALKLEKSGYLEDAYYELNVPQASIQLQAPASLCFVNRLDRLVSEPVTWLEGWDEERAMSCEEKICILPIAYAEKLDVKLGDKINVAEYDIIPNLQLEYHLLASQWEETVEAAQKERPMLKIIGLIESSSSETLAFIPIASWQSFYFLFSNPPLDLATYALTDYHQATEFREYAGDVLSTAKNIVELELDTGNADRIYQIHRLIETLYPLTIGAALLLEGVLSGLTVLHFSRDISILRALGTKKRRTVSLYTLSQLVPALLGAILGFALVFCTRELTVSAVWKPFAAYFIAQLLLCGLGSGVFAWLSARKNVLTLLQALE